MCTSTSDGHITARAYAQSIRRQGLQVNYHRRREKQGIAATRWALCGEKSTTVIPRSIIVIANAAAETTANNETIRFARMGKPATAAAAVRGAIGKM